MKYFKLGQTVYDYAYGQGVVIGTSNGTFYPIVVEFEKYKITYTEDGCQIIDGIITLSQTPIAKIINVPLEDTYVPFTIDNDILGQTVISKDKSCKGVITYQDKHKIVIGSYNITYKELLKEYTFIDDKPCGKL